MKKIAGIIIVTVLLFACNSGTKTVNTPPTDSALQTQGEERGHPNNLTLHNGVKWKVDSTTLLNVILLQREVYVTGNASPESYKAIAERLQADLNKLVSECKMKGADHEVLHHWLEPLVDKTRDLKNAGSIENALTIFSDIQKQVSLFSQYFE